MKRTASQKEEVEKLEILDYLDTASLAVRGAIPLNIYAVASQVAVENVEERRYAQAVET